MKAVCFSVAAIDYFPQQDKYFVGGNSLNQAICYRHLGFQSAFVGAIGNDDAGDQIAALMRAEGVDISCMHRLNGESARNKIINDEFGERYGIEGAWEGGVYEQFKLIESDWDFMNAFNIWSTHANSPCYAEALKRKNNQQLMSVDFLDLRDFELLERSLKVIDIAFFGGTADILEDLARIAKNNPGIIVLTLGSAGSIAFEGDKIYQQAALPVEKVIDTTGCGDAFQAGFTAYYYETRDIPAALFAGAWLGRKAATGFGGTSWTSKSNHLILDMKTDPV